MSHCYTRALRASPSTGAIICCLLMALPTNSRSQQAGSETQNGVKSQEIEEVLVTAQKRDENARDVPITISAFDEAAIQQHGFTSLTDYAKFVPGLIYNGTGIGERSGPDITIRGIANSRLYDMETNIGTPTTGFVYGEVPAYSMNPELDDIQRIEILKGPQGTLYGAAAMGGLVKVVPSAPNLQQFSGSASGGFSGTATGWGAGATGKSVSGILNVPLSDILAVRVAMHYKQDPGYLNVHIVSGDPHQQYGYDPTVGGFNSLATNVFGANGEFIRNANTSTAYGGRVAIRFKPDDKLDVTLSSMLDYNYIDTLPNYEPVLSTAANPRTSNQFQLQPASTNYSLSSLEASYDLGLATLHSVSGYIDRRHSSLIDATGSIYNGLGGNGLVPAPAIGQITFGVDEKIFSQELRLEGSAKQLFGSSLGLDWSTGVFYQHEDRRAVGNATVGAAWLTNAQAPLGVPPSGTTSVWDGLYTGTYKNKAAFADVTLHLLPRLSVSGGLRYSDQTLDALRTDFSDVFSGCPPTETCSLQEPASGKQVTPRATAEFAATDSINLYAAYSTGFRIGGFNSVGSISTQGCQVALQKFGITDPNSVAKYDTDKLRNIEAGLKGLLFERRLSVNVSVFQEDWTNLQSTIALNQYSPDCGGNFITNAGAARVDGTEIEARTNLNDHFSLYATGQYQYARIVSVEAGSAGSVGAPLQSAPRVQLASGLAYEVTPIKDWYTTARIDYAYVGARNMSNTNTPVDPNYQLPGYSTVNLRLEVTHEGWAFTGYINNLTDSVPQLGVQVLPGGPGNYTGGFAPALLRQVTTAPPRVVGVLVRRDF